LKKPARQNRPVGIYVTMSALKTLVEPAQLRDHLNDPDWVVIDCRFELSRPAAGREAYLRSHIPGARYAHLDEDLSSAITPSTGRHPLPGLQQFLQRVRQWGIAASTQVVAYDDANGAFAARLWWLLRWVGHDRVAVLNGGFKTWEAADLPISTEIPSAPLTLPSPRDGGEGKKAWLTTDEIQRSLAHDSILLVDARGADRFAGQNETIDPVAGHIPGARNHPFTTNLDTNQRFLPPEELRARWQKTLAGRPATDVVAMCGSGVTACHNLLALEVAGFSGARLYAGSWSEWIRDPSRPVVK
jgi:thiosulfate/3-mercaptopyruvate sulfurtransferase